MTTNFHANTNKCLFFSCRLWSANEVKCRTFSVWKPALVIFWAADRQWHNASVWCLNTCIPDSRKCSFIYYSGCNTIGSWEIFQQLIWRRSKGFEGIRNKGYKKNLKARQKHGDAGTFEHCLVFRNTVISHHSILKSKKRRGWLRETLNEGVLELKRQRLLSQRLLETVLGLQPNSPNKRQMMMTTTMMIQGYLRHRKGSFLLVLPKKLTEIHSDLKRANEAAFVETPLNYVWVSGWAYICLLPVPYYTVVSALKTG